MKDLAVTLEKAADLLDEKGWIKNAYFDDKGRMCVAGAINTAKGLEGVYRANSLAHTLGSDNIRWITRFMNHDRFTGTDSLIDFNDHIAKDKRQVTRLLRRMAKAWRAEHSS